MIDRHAFLKALCAVPVGIALTRWTEAVTHAVMELWSRGALVAVRPVAMTTTYQTFTYDLGLEEAARIEDWADLSMRIVSNGDRIEISSLELSAPAPHEPHVS